MQLTLPIATGPKISNTYVRMRDPSLQVRPRVSTIQVRVRGCGSLINGFSMFHPHQQQQPDTGQTADSNREQSDNGHIQHRQGSIIHHNVLGSKWKGGGRVEKMELKPQTRPPPPLRPFNRYNAKLLHVYILKAKLRELKRFTTIDYSVWLA